SEALIGGVDSSRTSPVSRWFPRTSPSWPDPVGFSRVRPDAKGSDLNGYEHRLSRPSASPPTDGLSNWVLPDLDPPLRHRGRLPQGRRDWTNQPVYKARAASPPSRPAMVSRSSPITNLFSLAVIGSSRADSLDKTPTVHPRAPRTTPALPVP